MILRLAFNHKIQISLQRIIDALILHIGIEESHRLSMETPHTLISVFNTSVFLGKCYKLSYLFSRNRTCLYLMPSFSISSSPVDFKA